MGYGAKKLEIEGKIKRVKRILLGVLLVAILGLCIFSAFVPAESWKYYVNLPNVSKRKEGEMRLHFLDVGQGDASIIELPDGKILMVDGGNGSESTAKTVLRYLNALKIKKIDYLVVSHADSDHCGSLDVLLRYKEVDKVFLPKVSPLTNDEYAEFYNALSDTDSTVFYTHRNQEIRTSNEAYPFTLSFLYPYTLSVETENEQLPINDGNEISSVFWLDYQGMSALFTGDAPISTEEILMRDDKVGVFDGRGVDLQSTEILKVAHHGSRYSTSEEFLSYLQVKTAVISCGENNVYGHPAAELCSRLIERQIATYRTDKQGHVVITITHEGYYQTQTI